MSRTPLMYKLIWLNRVAEVGADEGLNYQAAKQALHSRRRFVQGVAAMTAAAATPAWAAAVAQPAPRIVIVGGGLAGLTCAHELHRRKINITVYEASDRLGGRCVTNRLAFAGQYVEEGGEFIHSSHEDIRHLASELGLELQDLKHAYDMLPGEAIYFFQGAPYTAQQAYDDFIAISDQVRDDFSAASFPTTWNQHTPRAAELDRMSITQWIQQHVPGGTTSRLGQLLNVAYVTEFGAECNEQSALNFINTLGRADAGSASLLGASDRRYQVKGGNDLLVKRLATPLGNNRIRLQHALTRMALNEDATYALLFSTPAGPLEVQADHVALALPFSILRRSVDYKAAGFDPRKRTAIEKLPMGASTKQHVGFATRYWRDAGSNGLSYSDNGYQSAWEATLQQPGAHGVLTSLVGGKLALAMNKAKPAVRAAEFIEQLNQVIPGLAEHVTGTSLLSDWPRNPWTRGSNSYYAPGHYTSFAGYEGMRQGNCHFCGEHTSIESHGTMNGAVQSGTQCAEEIASDLQAGNGVPAGAAMVAAEAPMIAMAAVAEEPLAAQASATPICALPANRVPVPSVSLWDGASGLTRDSFNQGLRVSWRNKGGDWLDANGVKQGTAPFATGAITGSLATSSAPKTIRIDITALYSKWKAVGNKGLAIRSRNKRHAQFRSREALETAQRPVLHVQTTTGTVTCHCVADAHITMSAGAAQGKTKTLYLGTSDPMIAMQFDRSPASNRTIKKVELVLTMTRAQAVDTLDVYLLDPPTVLVDPYAQNTQRRLNGLAASHPYDAGLDKHPDVIAVGDFREGWKTRFHHAWAKHEELHYNAQRKSWFLRAAASNLGNGGQDCGITDIKYRFKATDGKPMNDPRSQTGTVNEVYFRYSMQFDQDWGSMVSGGKAIGIASTWMNPRIQGGWYGAQGGSPANGGAWSWRGDYQPKPTDDNPLKELVAVGSQGGDLDYAGSNDFHTVRWPHVCLAKGRVYDIEQHIKLNTITNVNTSSGVGTAVADGVHEVWIDGVLIFARTNVRFRNRVKSTIQECWWNWYHGGVSPPAPGKVHHVRMGDFVIARKYIGPRTM